MKKEKGITIIVLIITIIIMLILIGVTIDIVVDEGLFDKAENIIFKANEKTNQEQEMENNIFNDENELKGIKSSTNLVVDN